MQPIFAFEKYVYCIYFYSVTENHGLDVRFDDPTTGFFLRRTNAASSSSSSGVISSASAASVGTSTLGVASPTTSIILGTSGAGRNEILKEKGKTAAASAAAHDFQEKSTASVPTSRSASPVLGDILRSER